MITPDDRQPLKKIHVYPMNRNETFNPLFTDLYELTMMLAYGENHLAAKAAFSLYIRGFADLNRGFFVAAGLEDAQHGLENMRFSQTDINPWITRIIIRFA